MDTHATTAILHYVQSVWPFSKNRNDDLKVSDALVKNLDIPDDTKRFVFAIKEPESQSVIYILCAQNLSERSAVDAERLIRCVRPDAVVGQVNEFDFKFEDDDCSTVPTSSFSVLKRCFLDKICKDKYEDLAGNLVLKEIFGVGFNGHLSSAKRVAEEVGSSFLLLESSNVNIESKEDKDKDSFSTSNEVESGDGFQGFNNLVPPQNVTSNVSSGGGSRYFIKDGYVSSQTLKSLRSYLVQVSSDVNTGDMNVDPKDDYEAPQYARAVYPLLEDLHSIFQEIPSMGRALANAQKMFHDISEGDDVDTHILSEVYAFRIAVEGLRIALNNAGRMPIGTTGNRQNVEFSDLPNEEKSHALLANVLRSQTNNFKSIVAVLDASSLAGIRKHWNTVVPPNMKDIVEEMVAESTKDGETTNHREKKRRLTDKPVVAVGAGATAVLGASSLSKAVPASTFMKVVTFKVPFSLKLIMTQTQKLVSITVTKILGPSKVITPGMKAAASAEKIRTIVHSVIASAEKTSLSAMRGSFYEIMWKRRRVRPIGVLPWATFGCSVATCSSLLVYGDGIECVVESIPSAPSIASLGRGIQSLQQASVVVAEMESSRIHKSIESLVNRFKKWKTAP